MKIFLIVERRADYSRMKPILELISKDNYFEYILVVTGLCLKEEHGLDINYIKKDGFNIYKIVQMFDESYNDGVSMVKGFSKFTLAITDILAQTNPDLVLSGFDIGANFGLTIAAAHLNIPIAHIQGGEVTGSIDESIRHSMSKFSNFHFPATKKAKKRLVRMGENPNNIFVVGCPSIDVLKNTPTIDKKNLYTKFNLDINKKLILMIQHPVTTENNQSKNQIIETLNALKRIDEQTIILLPNNDSGASEIINEIKNSKLKWFTSLDTLDFINIYRNSNLIIGNSSSGIHEAPFFKIPSINIGTRQNKRERAISIIDVENDSEKIYQSINFALNDKLFLKKIEKTKSLFGDGNSSKRIIEVLKKIKLPINTQKTFYE